MDEKESTTMTMSDNVPQNAGDWLHPIANRRVISKRYGGEVTPFVFKNRFYRLENVVRSKDFPKEKPQYRFHEDGFRIRDVEKDRIISVPLLNHYFATAFVWRDKVHVFCGDYGDDQPWWSIKRYVMITSTDLITWTSPRTVVEANPNENLFNNSVCHDGKRFLMLIETDDPQWVKFTFKFYESDDLKEWRLVDGALYGEDKYVGGPSLYFLDNYYYLLYVARKEDLGHETRITRSRDLLHWEDAPLDRPFLTFDPSHEVNPDDYPGVMERNASDAELCEWNGKTMIYFCGGNQAGCADLKEAVYNGKPADLLNAFFQ